MDCNVCVFFNNITGIRLLSFRAKIINKICEEFKRQTAQENKIIASVKSRDCRAAP